MRWTASSPGLPATAAPGNSFAPGLPRNCVASGWRNGRRFISHARCGFCPQGKSPHRGRSGSAADGHSRHSPVLIGTTVSAGVGPAFFRSPPWPDRNGEWAPLVPWRYPRQPLSRNSLPCVLPQIGGDSCAFVALPRSALGEPFQGQPRCFGQQQEGRPAGKAMVALPVPQGADWDVTSARRRSGGRRGSRRGPQTSGRAGPNRG
jgi:hypothetical protein